MRLKITESKNARSLYVIKSVYNKETQSNTSKIVEKLGTYDDLKKSSRGKTPSPGRKNILKNSTAWKRNRTRISWSSSPPAGSSRKTGKPLITADISFSSSSIISWG